MKVGPNNNTTPGGTQSTRFEAATRHSDYGESRLTQGKSEFSGKLPRKTPTYMETFNINTLIQPGKLHHLVMELNKQKIKILALQETRFTDEDTMDYGNYRIFKSKTTRKVGRNTPMLGMAFLVHKSIIGSIREITPINERLMTMRLQCTKKTNTMINVYAPTNQDNKKQPEKTEKVWT